MTSHPDTGPRRSGLTRLLTLGSLLWLGVLLTVSQAQITLDGSLGPRGPVTGPDYRIGAELGQLRGGNLFHSFGAFNVPTAGSATFTGPNTIANIVSRVTGGQPSAIDGVLRSEIAGANLYLLNPSGVLFGPNAALEVSGSFHVSTADFLRFADGAKFHANLAQASVLTVASPTAFGFLGSNPAAITIQGSSLKVSEGKALSVVGGDVTILGNNGPLTDDSVPTLHAPSGRIHLASVASPGEAMFSPLELAPDLQVDGFTRLGRMALSQSAFVNVNGNGGGSVLLRSGRLRVDGSWMFADNTGPIHGAGVGLDLRIGADAVLTNGALLTTDSLSAGRARDLRVVAGSLQLLDGSLIGARGFGSGDGPNIAVQVGTLTLTGGARLSSSTRGSGRGGELGVAASEAVSIAGENSGLFSSAFGTGEAGRLAVEARRLTLTDGAQINSGTFGSGRGGDLRVMAADAISIAGQDSRGFPSGLFSSAFGSGAGGRLFVSTPLLTMDGGLIQAGGSPGSSGNAGSLDVRTGRLTLTGGAQLSSSARGAGRGGAMTVLASEAISIAGEGSGLFSSAFGSGDAGRLAISTPLLTMDGGGIRANTLGDGNAGNIEVRAGGSRSPGAPSSTAAPLARGGAGS